MLFSSELLSHFYFSYADTIEFVLNCSVMLHVTFQSPQTGFKSTYGWLSLDFKSNKLNYLQQLSDGRPDGADPLVYFKYLNNFLIVNKSNTTIIDSGLDPVLAISDPKAFSCEVDKNFLGSSIKTNFVAKSQLERFLLFYVTPESLSEDKDLAAIIGLALKYDNSLLGNGDLKLISVSNPFTDWEIKNGLIKHKFCFYSPLISMDCNTTTDQFYNEINYGNLFEIIVSKSPIFFIVKVKTIKPRFNLNHLNSKNKNPHFNQSRSFHTSPIPNQLLVAAPKAIVAPLPILATMEEKNGLRLYLSNPQQLTGEQLSKNLYDSISQNPHFKDCGANKYLTVAVSFDEKDFNEGRTTGQHWAYHKFVPITNETTPEQYWAQVETNVLSKYIDNLYEDKVPKILIARVKNVDHLVNTNISKIKDSKGNYEFKVERKVGFFSPFGSIQKRSIHSAPVFCASANRDNQKYISAVKVNNKTPFNSFSALDIETISVNNTEIPVAISLVMFEKDSVSDQLEKYFFHVDKKYLKYSDGILNLVSLETEVNRMWVRLNKTLVKKASEGSEAVKYIFVHNLGAFDGYFIFKYFNLFFKNENIYTIIDKQNKFITMSFTVEKYKTDIKFIDSYRIFPVGLQDLCKVFNVDGKTMPYSSYFHDISVFYDKDMFNKFKDYSIQDSVCLYRALLEAQKLYWNDFKVDITTIVSASSLAFKIFRTNYLSHKIPIPSYQEDTFVRESYFGGAAPATDIYKASGRNLFYLDVNSLYPHAMLNKMPFEFKSYHKDMSCFDLENFFGFVKVRVTCPTTVIKPILPLKTAGNTIFPVGTWIGTYFSEEIKAVLSKNLGYVFEFISGYEYSSEFLFTEYVKDLYKVKREAIGPVRFIAKLLLNTLYVTFGRKLETTEVIVINEEDEDLHIATSCVLTSIPLGNNKLALIIQNSVLPDINNTFNITTHTNVPLTHNNVKANIAIASATTAYARIHMMDLKLHDSCYYTDTDSIFVDDLEPFKHLIGKELGQLKLELGGNIVQEAEFIDIKQYGYWYLDKNDCRIECSVFAGVGRDSIPFYNIQKLQRGETLTIEALGRFYKSLLNLDIKINSCNITISKTNSKPLINNKYYPININC